MNTQGGHLIDLPSMVKKLIINEHSGMAGHSKNVVASLRATRKSRLAIIKVKRPELESSSKVPVH